MLKENTNEDAKFKKVEVKPDRFRHIDLTKDAQKDLKSNKGYKGYKLVPAQNNNKAILALIDMKSNEKINTPDSLDLHDTVAVLKYINNMVKDTIPANNKIHSATIIIIYRLKIFKFF